MKLEDWTQHCTVVGIDVADPAGEPVRSLVGIGFRVGANEGFAWCEPGYGIEGYVGAHVIMAPIPDAGPLEWPLSRTESIWAATEGDEAQIAAIDQQHPGMLTARLAVPFLMAWHGDSIGDRGLTRIIG